MVDKKVDQINTEGVKEVQFSRDDFRPMADFIYQEWQRRKNDRKDLEKQWDEIDRQLRLEPNRKHKSTAHGQRIQRLDWMSETELPLQAQTLEMLMADAKRMKFPRIGKWFKGRAGMTDDYMERFAELRSPTGSDDEPHTRVQQDVGDRLAEAVVQHWHDQYDFQGHYDQIDAEAFKYGTGIGRIRKTTKRSIQHTQRGAMEKDETFPMLIPQSLRETYLDDRHEAIAAEGYALGPLFIYERTQNIDDLRMAADAGKSDVTDEVSGGWDKQNLKQINGDKDGRVTTLEAEGDLIVPRADSTSIFLRNVIVNIAIGQSDSSEGTPVVFRVRFRKNVVSSYLVHPYHRTRPHEPYATSPLMMGWPIQDAATQSLNRVIDSGLLNTMPPLSYRSDEPQFAATGGPNVAPGAQWDTASKVDPIYIGAPQHLLEVYKALLQQYYDVTGVNKPRLGQQTTSHTTATAKQAELQQSQIRTVDFVQSSLRGPMTRLLDIEYKMGLEEMRSDKNLSLYIDEWDEFVHIQKGHLPDLVHWQAIGSAAASANEQEQAERMEAVQFALQLDQMRVQMGEPPKIDQGQLMEHVLRQGGWQDIPFLTNSPTQVEPADATQGVQAILNQAEGTDGPAQ